MIGVDTNVIMRLLVADDAGTGCEYTATFDRKVSKLPEFRLLSA